MVEQFQVGQRVRLKRRPATIPRGLYPKGATGTVVKVGENPELGKIVWVRMDRHFPTLARDHNVMLVLCGEITAETSSGLWARLSAAWRGE
jgi:hypothetical protein